MIHMIWVLLTTPFIPKQYSTLAILFALTSLLTAQVNNSMVLVCCSDPFRIPGKFSQFRGDVEKRKSAIYDLHSILICGKRKTFSLV